MQPPDRGDVDTDDPRCDHGTCVTPLWLRLFRDNGRGSKLARRMSSRIRRMDALVGSLIFLICFAVFRSAPNDQHTDSRYSMLLAENLLRHGDFDLSRYDLPDNDYRLQGVGSHRY